MLASANGNRKAERPLNAIENYLYSLAEAEAVLACQVVGLDPGLGFVHNDARGRQSLALDLIEPVRPQVDAFALDLLERRTFRKVEFTETADGHCRVKAPLTHELAETVPRWSTTQRMLDQISVEEQPHPQVVWDTASSISDKHHGTLGAIQIRSF